MAVHEVLRMGHPVLREVARPVEAFDAELERLVADLWESMHAHGGIGIAAPQIGVSKRVVVFGLDESERPPGAPDVPRTVLVNPQIEPLDDSVVEGWEACLSVPGLRGIVPRHERIRYTGFDAAGRRFSREVDEFHARVVQHECDHLDGMLYPMRMTDLSSFGFDAELRLSAPTLDVGCGV